MKILAFIPMSPLTDPDDPLQVRIFGRSLQSILEVDYSGEISYHFERDDFPWKRSHHERYNHILLRYQLARKLFLRGDYDALWTAESDMVIPKDALLRMTAILRDGFDVAYGTACSRYSKRINVFFNIEEASATFLQDDADFMKKHWGEVIETEGGGFGCTLISRRVLEEIDFRRKDGGPSNDWYFAIDCKEKGFKQASDLGLLCGHITVRPAPFIIWPDIHAERYYSLEALPGVIVDPYDPEVDEDFIMDFVGEDCILSYAEAKAAGLTRE